MGAEEEAQGGRGVLAGLDEAVVDGGGVGDGLEGEGGAPAEIACVGQGLVLAQDEPGLLPQDGGQGFAAGLDAGELGLSVVSTGDEAHVTAPPGGLPDLVGALGHLVRREEDDGDGPGAQDGVEGGRDVFPRLGADGQVEGEGRGRFGGVGHVRGHGVAGRGRLGRGRGNGRGRGCAGGRGR